MIRSRLIAFPCVALLAACATAPTGRNAPAVNASVQPQVMVSDRLFFGRGEVTDSAWTAFLGEVVTPRFPDGLTVFEGYGQWTDPRGKLAREPAWVIEMDHPPGAAYDSIFANITSDWLKRFHQDAVLRITTPVQMRLYRSDGR